MDNCNNDKAEIMIYNKIMKLLLYNEFNEKIYNQINSIEEKIIEESGKCCICNFNCSLIINCSECGKYKKYI